MVDLMPIQARKGRGAVSNETGRFEARTAHRVDDGWTLDDADAPPLRTTVTIERPKRIIARNTSPDIPFDRSINPYRGCEHGCVYCFARPTHAFHGLSPGLDFESRLFAKPDAAALLETELRRPIYRPATIAIGTNTDPYQPIEKDRRIMRGVLEVLDAYNHPVSIVTKSALILRDLDILASMAERGLVGAAVSVTTLDRELARRLEPRAATPARRIDTIAALAGAGVPVACMTAPMIPGLHDHEMETILEAAAAAGATAAEYILLRLPLEIKDLFAEWLDAHAPARKNKVLNMMRASRDGHLYVADWGRRMKGTGTYAELLAKRFRLAEKRLGLANHPAAGFRLRADLFAPPPRAGDQLNLF